MSDDLVKRLRRYAKDQGGWHNIDDTCEEAADSIEELEAKMAKAMELANLVVEFSDRALWKVVKEVVLELKGEK
jgi:hypothetical protein